MKIIKIKTAGDKPNQQAINGAKNPLNETGKKKRRFAIKKITDK